MIDRNRRQGEKTPDARFDVTSIRVHDVEASAGLAEVTAVAAAYPVVDGDGKVVDRVAEQKMHLDLSLSRTSSGDWIIGNWFNLGGA